MSPPDCGYGGGVHAYILEAGARDGHRRPGAGDAHLRAYGQAHIANHDRSISGRATKRAVSLGYCHTEKLTTSKPASTAFRCAGFPTRSSAPRPAGRGPSLHRHIGENPHHTRPLTKEEDQRSRRYKPSADFSPNRASKTKEHPRKIVFVWFYSSESGLSKGYTKSKQIFWSCFEPVVGVKTGAPARVMLRVRSSSRPNSVGLEIIRSVMF